MALSKLAKNIVVEAHNIRIKSNDKNAEMLERAITKFEEDEEHADLLLALMTAISEKNGMHQLVSKTTEQFERECG